MHLPTVESFGIGDRKMCDDNEIQLDDDAIDRRRFLKCMAGAGYVAVP